MSDHPRPKTRPTPAEHAQQAFTPIDVPVPPPVLKGPLITTASDHPSPSPSSSTSTSSFSSSSSIPSSTADSIPPNNAQPVQETIAVKVQLTDAELDEARRWTEERIQRKLRGEYERAGQQLSELVNDSLDTRLRLNSIRIIGAKSTRPSFLSSLVAPYLPPLPPPSYLATDPNPTGAPRQTLSSLLATTRDLSTLFAKFDLFREIDATLEQAPSVLAEPDDVDIVLRVKEAPKYFLRTATDVGDGEGSATATARIRNAFGGAETVEGNVSFGTRTKSAFQLRVDSPINASPDTRAELAAFSANRDLGYYASCGEYTKGAQAKIRTLTPFGLSELTYEAVLREISDLLPRASMSIRSSAGPSVKSCVSHTLTRDTRDDLFAPTRGSFLRLRQEYAGLGGDAQFFKTESESTLSRTITKGWVMSLGVRTGVLIPLNPGRSSSFIDRFHLGGPTSVRQFSPCSMGPRDAADYLGGDLTWSTGLSLTAPFPGKPDWPLKVHSFVNAGKLTAYDQAKGGKRMMLDLIKEPSVSVGLGLMYRHSLVRIEANIGVPVAMGKQEGGVKGLQFGLGLSFL